MNHTAKADRLRLMPSEQNGVSSLHALRAKPLRGHITTPSVEPIIKWTLRFKDEEKRPPMMVVPGASIQDRMDFYRRYLSDEWASFRPDTIEDIVGPASRDWVNQTVLSNLTGRVAMARVPVEARHDLPKWFPPPASGWEILWALAAVPTFTIEEPLRGMVDQAYYLFHDLYVAIWELRFRLRENPNDFEPSIQFFNAVTRWCTASRLDTCDHAMLDAAGVSRRLTGDRERLDVLLFLLTLAEHNGLLNRYVVCFDGLERALTPDGRPLLREMVSFLATLDRWIRLSHTPMGVLIGMDTSPKHMAALRKLSPRLAADVMNGLAWTRP